MYAKYVYYVCVTIEELRDKNDCRGFLLLAQELQAAKR